jgi:DNA-directed RNA polymerase subunit RPC12/RpoP
MSETIEVNPTRSPSFTALPDCPQCRAQLAIMRIIPGKSSEYWTLRCTRCGGIHLDIVKPRPRMTRFRYRRRRSWR